MSDEEATMEVRVTQRDINAGQPSLTRCPIALALKRDQGGTWSVSDSFIAWFGDGPVCENLPLKTWDTPDEASMFITRFDSIGRRAVHPFGFEL